MLRLSNLSKRYGSVVALDECNFTVPRGVLMGFLGPNGAGKTTAMRTVFGLVTPDEGSVSWNDQEITQRARLRFGYMPEQRGLYPRMRIGRQLSYLGQLHGMPAKTADEATRRWLETLGLADRSTDRLEDLSHGNQQRVQLAAALVHDPELLVLDEPFSGLDPIGVQAMADILAERAAAGTAVVFSSHQLDLVEDLCESVVIIDRGSIVLSGTVRQLRASSPHRYVDLEVDGVPSGWYQTLESTELVSQEDGRARLRVQADADPARLLQRAEAAGAVREFSFAPPSLSQVFREAVGQ